MELNQSYDSFKDEQEESFHEKLNYQQHQSTLEKDEHQSQKRRIAKNKYINKIKQQLQSGSTSQILTFPHTHPSSQLSQGRSSRRQKNKLKAQQARDRKNYYTKLMQQKIQQLQTQLQDVNKEIVQARQQIYSAQMHQRTQGKQSKHQQIHIINKLDKMMTQQINQERRNEINICLDSIIYRIGALGKERKTALSKLYHDLLNFSQPALYRYILWSAVGKKHLFGSGQQNEQEKWPREIQQIALEAVNAAQTNGDDLQKRGEQIANHCQHFTKSAQDLVYFRRLFQKKGQSLDNVFNQIRQILAPQQVAQMILFIQKNAFKRQLCLFENDDDAHSRKKRKPNEEQQ